jgi:hypothetical protein
MACAVLASLGGVVSCLPLDTRPVPGSILLNLVADDEPSVMTADGWSIAVDRLLLGIGNPALDRNPWSSNRACTSYSDTDYDRVLDGRLPTAQKVGLVYGLGQCDFAFRIASPSGDAILGEGVSEADRDAMTGTIAPPGARADSIAVDFAATATQANETMRVHWKFRQPASYFNCKRQTETGLSLLRLESNDNITLHVGIRGVELFGNDESADAELRFEPLAYADREFGNQDGDITLEEMGRVDLSRLRGFGPYSAGSNVQFVPRTLADYMNVVLLPKIARFREKIVCQWGRPGGPPPP